MVVTVSEVAVMVDTILEAGIVRALAVVLVEAMEEVTEVAIQTMITDMGAALAEDLEVDTGVAMTIMITKVASVV